jgi:crotonobetainyl-CoA:carnitine CoA-transferase CaiB-like acyl-CoA transferase
MTERHPERRNGSSNGVHGGLPPDSPAAGIHYPPQAQQPPADANPPYRLPLAGVRVLDMSVFQQGTYASAMLADMGADVVKIEGPNSPDPGRGGGGGDAPNGLSPYFQHLNRNKRGICLDLKHPQGKETFLKLVETADIFHNNMRPGVLDRLGLTYEVLKGRNPRIILSNATGWGNEGPDAAAKMGSMDVLAQARGGIMSVTGTPESGPLAVGVPFADHVGALVSAFGMMTALWEREQSGEGQISDTSLYGSQLCIQGLNVTAAMWGMPVRGLTADEDRAPHWSRYLCEDGLYLLVGGGQPAKWWTEFCEVMGAPELAEGGAPAHIKSDQNRQRRAALQKIFLTKTRDEWLSILRPRFFVQPIADYLEIAEDEQPWANGYLTNMPDPRDPEAPFLPTVGPPVRLSRTPPSVRSAAPEFGQHTEEVLQEAGFDWDQINELREAGAFGDLANVAG